MLQHASQPPRRSTCPHLSSGFETNICTHATHTSYSQTGRAGPVPIQRAQQWIGALGSWRDRQVHSASLALGQPGLVVLIGLTPWRAFSTLQLALPRGCKSPHAHIPRVVSTCCFVCAQAAQHEMTLLERHNFASSLMARPAAWQGLLARAILSLVGLFWSLLVIFKLAVLTFRKRGANFSTVPREGLLERPSILSECTAVMSQLICLKSEPAAYKSDKYGKHTTVKANGIDFHCVVKGSGPLMLMLHGFPEVCLR